MAALCLSAASLAAPAQDHQQHPTHAAAPPPFVASTAKPYASLIDDAMGVMHPGMTQAPTNGVPDHDFVAMMIPHHQGAIDMAKTEQEEGEYPDAVALAEEIEKAQTAEITTMNELLGS